MRILFDVSALGTSPNGSTVNALRSANALALSRPEWEVGLISAPAQAGVLDQLLPVDSPVRKTVSSPDLIHFPHQVSAADLGHCRARYGVPVSATWLDFIALRRPEYHRSSRAWAAALERAALAVSSMDGVVWLSDAVAEQASVFGWAKGVPSSVVGLGVDHLAPDDERAAASAVVRRVAEQQPYIVMIAATYPHKRRALAIEAIARARDRGVELNLILAGSDAPHWLSTRQRDRALCRDLGIEASVHDLGSVSEADLGFLYRNAVGSLALSEEEGFGMVPYESALLGCPCITTLGATAERVDHRLASDASASAVAERIAVLGDLEARSDSVARLSAAAAQHTWAEAGARLSNALSDFASSAAPRHRPRWALPRDIQRAAWKLNPSLGSLLSL